MLAHHPAIFPDRHKFQDDIWGQIALNDLERDVIDTPEFQRLFRTSQLGFVDLVYQTANHTRGAHSIGACHLANMLINHLQENTNRFRGDDSRYAPIEVSPAERILIRLGALLHDISHVPLSHDIERKSHKITYQPGRQVLKLRSYYGHYDKHDDYDRNPLLYLLLCDHNVSVLARVLRHYSKEFHRLLGEHAQEPAHQGHLTQFLALLATCPKQSWDPDQELLPALLFHLLTYEDADEASMPVREIATSCDAQGKPVRTPWGLGPTSLQEELHRWWYQPFRHDIIGNTLSADLLDYLSRDPQRLGMHRTIDLHLLNYYVLVRSDLGTGPPAEGNALQADGLPREPGRYRCAIDLQDHKRGTSRTGLVNDIFRLLDLRHEIHEKAVMHRVVHAANGMLSRALLLLGDRKPRPTALIQVGDCAHALHGEDAFYRSLLNITEEHQADPQLGRRHREARSIILKLIDRRVYRPLIIIPGNRAAEHFLTATHQQDTSDRTELRLRTLAAIIDSPYYSAFLLFVSGCVEMFLQGAFETTAQVCGYSSDLAQTEDDDLLRSAMELVPSRVIIWTTPYKQLYKDPAVVVALQDTVRRIDELTTDGNAVPATDASLLTLIEASIKDADSKYAALWKLFVFISDGLFYTGVLRKLQGMIAGGIRQADGETHQERLRRSQAFFIAAFDVISQNWSEFCQREKSIKPRQAHLQERMEPGNFCSLVTRWIATYQDQVPHQGDPTLGLSTVDVGHYVHEWDSATHTVGANCRDIRYKADRPATEEWNRARAEASGPRKNLVTFLERTGIRDSTGISALEFELLVGLYDDNVHRECMARLDADERADAVLALLWQAGFPLSDSTPLVKRSSPTLFPVESEPLPLPESRDAIQRWLAREAQILHPHVRRQLLEDRDEIVTFLDSLEPDIRQPVLADLRTRLVNEAGLLTNNLKAHQIVSSLQRKAEALRGSRAGAPLGEANPLDPGCGADQEGRRVTAPGN